MGGRGASAKLGRGIVAIRIDFGNGNTTTFRKGPSGRITDIDQMEQKQTNGLSIGQIMERAVSNGYNVTTYNRKQIAEYDAAYRAERANRPDYELGYGTGNMREYSRGARRNRLADRTMRRGAR